MANPTAAGFLAVSLVWMGLLAARPGASLEERVAGAASVFPVTAFAAAALVQSRTVNRPPSRPSAG